MYYRINITEENSMRKEINMPQVTDYSEVQEYLRKLTEILRELFKTL